MEEWVIRVWRDGKSEEFKTNENEYEILNAARCRLLSALDFEEKYESLIQNYIEFEHSIASFAERKGSSL
jgi:hypothetical protein